jgi:hypothetical protein
MATTRIVIGSIEIAGVTVGLTTAAVVARMLSVLQHACDGATETQHAPMGSAAANTAITSTPTRHLTALSSSHPLTIAMRAINPSCDGNHVAS